MARRIHLLVKKTRLACGLPFASRTTTSPALVTCHNCQRSQHMADAEVAQQLNQKNRIV